MVKAKVNIKIVPPVISALKMKLNSFQKSEDVATKRQTSKDPTEIGNSADAVLPIDGAGAGDCSLTGPFIPEAAADDVGEDAGDCGETPPTRKK